MGEAAHSGAAVVGVAREVSPVVVSLVAVRPEVSPVVDLAAVAGFQAAVVEVAEAVDNIGGVK
jgi:hypothetical protein